MIARVLLPRRPASRSANISIRPAFASRRAVCLALAGLALAGTDVAAQAPSSRPSGAVQVGGEGPRNLFEARGVKVDVTAGTVTEARERALTQGRVNGLRRVLERLGARADLAKLPQLSPTEVIEMVQEFSLQNERTSAVRYLADMNVRFDPEAVRRLLRDAKISFTEFASPPLVVLPVYSADGQTQLWDKANPWRQAWAAVKERNGLVPLLLPPGDAQDMTLSLEQVTSKNGAALQALAARHDAAGVLVAQATPGTGGGITVRLSEFRGGALTGESTVNTPAAAGQELEDALLAAATAAAEAASEDWKKDNLVDLSVTSQLTALAPLRSLEEWLQIRERLKQIPLIERVDLQAITRDRAQITLRYGGDQGRLQKAMAQQSLSLTQQGGVYILTAARAAAP
jgi:hypothetical protein